MDLYLLPIPVRVFKKGRINRKWVALHGCLEHFIEQVDCILDNPEKVYFARRQLRRIILEYKNNDNKLGQMKNALVFLENPYDYINWN